MLLSAAAILALSLQSPVVVDRVDVPRPIQLAESWDDLNQNQRERALKNYQRYMQLPDEKRKGIDQKYERWKKMPKNDRARAREKHRSLGFAED